METERRVARTALALSVAAVILGPAAGFAAGYAFAEAGPPGEDGPAGPAGPEGAPAPPTPDISGAIVLTDTLCPAGTIDTETPFSIMFEGMEDFEGLAEAPPVLRTCRVLPS